MRMYRALVSNDKRRENKRMDLQALETQNASHRYGSKMPVSSSEAKSSPGMRMRRPGSAAPC